jgi:creatinine amidohydrolase
VSNWQDLTMPGLEALQHQTRTVILPLGALEEHGPHLPLGTDTFHALEVARRAARIHPVAVAPPLFYGMCRSTREHPGTVSISGDALRALLLDLGREFCRQGWHNLVFISGHAGGTHISAVVESAERLLAELPAVNIAVVNLLDLLR